MQMFKLQKFFNGEFFRNIRTATARTPRSATERTRSCRMRVASRRDKQRLAVTLPSSPTRAGGLQPLKSTNLIPGSFFGGLLF